MEEDDETISEKLLSAFEDDLFAKPMTKWKIYHIISLALSEFLGTFYLVMLGCATKLNVFPGEGSPANGSTTLLFIAMAWGFGYACMFVCTAHISGLCLNPALAMALHFVGELTCFRTILYIVMEILGALCAVYFLYFASGMRESSDLYAKKNEFCFFNPTDDRTEMFFVYEFYGTFWLCLLCILCYDRRTKDSFDFSPVKFGFSLVALNLALYRFNGCSLNFARTVAVTVMAGKMDGFLALSLAEVLAPALAAFFYHGAVNYHFVDPVTGVYEEP